jgi:hypothetical protein
MHFLFKQIFITFFVCFFLLNSQVNAEERTGIIEKLRVCGTGETGSSWRRTLQFKIDGVWFGTFADYYSATATDYDNDIASSLIISAFTQSRPVRIRATKAWDSRLAKCGVSSGYVFHSNAGDFIELEI